MEAIISDFNASVIEEFRAYEGHVGGQLEGVSLLLLRHTGAASGIERVTPLAYVAEGGGYAVFASKGGAPTHPGWYYNLRAHPNATVEVGPDTIDVVAREAHGDERERLFATQVERTPELADYEARSGRVIPVIVLEPAPSEAG